MRDLGRQARPGPLCPSLLAAARRGCGPAKQHRRPLGAAAPRPCAGTLRPRGAAAGPAKTAGPLAAALAAARSCPSGWGHPALSPSLFFSLRGFGRSFLSGLLLVRSGGSRFRSGGVGAGGPLLVAASFRPFRGWWSPGREVLAAWASVGVRLPRRVPVFVAWRFGAPGVRAPRSFAVVLPSGRVVVVVSRSVSLAPSAVWAGEWARRGGVGWSVVRSAVPSAVRACWPGEVSCGC